MDRKREKSCWHLSNPTMSQDVSLRDTYMKLKESCSLVDQTSYSDIQAVVQDDVASITLCHDSDEELSKSIIDESFMINDGSASNTTSTTDNDNDGDMDYSNCSRPYVPFSVEEVSLVRTLSLWSNRNVRVIGIAYPTDDLNFNLWKLVSIGEDGGPFSIIVDLTLAYFPAADCPIQVFGELQMMKNNHSPIIRVKFFRDFSSVDIFYHNKSVEVLKKYIPHFIDKRNPQPRLLDDSD